MASSPKIVAVEKPEKVKLDFQGSFDIVVIVDDVIVVRVQAENKKTPPALLGMGSTQRWIWRPFMCPPGPTPLMECFALHGRNTCYNWHS